MAMPLFRPNSKEQHSMMCIRVYAIRLQRSLDRNCLSNIKGIGKVYLNHNFVVNNVSVLQGRENLFVVMPLYKTKQKDEQGRVLYQDVGYLVTKEFREVLYGKIIDNFNATIDRTVSKIVMSLCAEGQVFTCNGAGDGSKYKITYIIHGIIFQIHKK